MINETFSIFKPEDMNVSSSAIKSTIDEIRIVDKLTLHSFLMLREGETIWEEYFRHGERDYLHPLWSVTKSFTSTAIGIASNQGLLSIEDKLYDFFPEYKQFCDSEYKAEITVGDLLMMGSGFENNENEIFGSFKDIVGVALSQPVIHKPKTVFNYYTLGSHLLSAIFSKVCSEGVSSYLKRKLFSPLGFGDFHWGVDNSGINTGGFGLYLRARDLLKFGKLYLQEGMWEGQQLVSKHYIKTATSKQIGNENHPSQNPDWTAGYGYQFWQNRMGGYRADGMFGQYIIVLPQKQTVIVMTSDLDDMQKPLTAIQNMLLPETR